MDARVHNSTHTASDHGENEATQRLVLAMGVVRLGAQQPPMVTVDIQDFSFQPRDVQVSVEAAVRWVNRDRESPHTVTAEDGKTVASPLIDPSKEFTFTFKSAGPDHIPVQRPPNYAGGDRRSGTVDPSVPL